MTVSVKRSTGFPCSGSRRTRLGLAPRALARGAPLRLLAGVVVVILTAYSRSRTWLGGHGGAPKQVSASVGIGMTPARSDAPTPTSWCRSLLHLSPRSPAEKPHKKRGLIARNAAMIDFRALGINELGQDFFIFLTSSIIVFPSCRLLNISPLLGFLFAGAILRQGELWEANSDEAAIADFGVLCLLFQIGLELTLDRLRRLGTFAVSLGLPALLISTVLLAALGLPPGEGVGTQLLMSLGGADPSLVSIQTLIEGIVVGAGLSLSSSAFVLQLLRDEGVIEKRLGNAVIGVLLLQDIAVVPLLALLPIVPLLQDTSNPDSLGNLAALAAGGAKGLGILSLVGLASHFIARPFLTKTAKEFGERSDALTAGVVFTIVLASLCTKGAGLSDSLGAFLIGILLADSGEVERIEETIAPFKGLLLGLFFLTVGASLDANLLVREWLSITLFLGGFMMVKAAAFVILGVTMAGLSRYEAVRLGFVLAQGGEFAFVIFQLADDLKILPDDLNDFLLIVIVLSIALTPALNALGIKVASMLPESEDEAGNEDAAASIEAAPPMRPVDSNVDEHGGVEAVLVTKGEGKVVAPASVEKL